MGWQFYENIYWPEEPPSWTSAACILAADANNQLTTGANLFIKQQFKSQLDKQSYQLVRKVENLLLELFDKLDMVLVRRLQVFHKYHE